MSYARESLLSSRCRMRPSAVVFSLPRRPYELSARRQQRHLSFLGKGSPSEHRSTFLVYAAAAEAESPAAESNPATNKKLRIKLKSFTVEPLTTAVGMIIDAAKNTGAQVAGPVPLPTRRKLYCVLRSPHVDKDSREHFELKTHSRLIDIKDLTAGTIDRLMELDIPAGVDANIKIM